MKSALSKGASAAHKLISPDSKLPATPPFSLEGIFSKWSTLWKNERSVEPANDPNLLLSSWTPWNQQKEQYVSSVVKNWKEERSYFDQLPPTRDVTATAIEVDDLAAAVRSYPTGKKNGIDGWHPKQLKDMPREILATFSDLLS